MSHSRQTEHYELPLYDGGDIINPLTDFNNANETIDEAVYNANQRSVGAETTAQEAKNIAQGYDARVAQAIETANNAMTLANNTQDMIAEDFNPTKEGGYKVGDYVIYNGVLYKFINAHTGAWDASDVQTSPVLIEAIADVVDKGKQAINDAVDEAEQEIAGQTEKVTKTQAMIAQPFDENKTGGYKVDDVVTYADKLYKFTSAHSGAWTGLDVEQVDVVGLMPNVIRIDLDHTSTRKTIVNTILSSLQTLGLTDLAKIKDCQLKICQITEAGTTSNDYRLQRIVDNNLELSGTILSVSSTGLNITANYLEMSTNPDNIVAGICLAKIGSSSAMMYDYSNNTDDIIYPSSADYFTGAYAEFLWQ